VADALDAVLALPWDTATAHAHATDAHGAGHALPHASQHAPPHALQHAPRRRARTRQHPTARAH
jgi:hypothetical protein